MSCRSPSFPLESLRPTLIHFCQHYVACADGSLPGPNNECVQAEVWNFHKGHVPPKLFGECYESLLVEPPEDLFDVQTTRRGRQNAFMICQLTTLVNRAVRAYKGKNCVVAGWDGSECIRLVLDTGAGKSMRLPNCPAQIGDA